MFKVFCDCHPLQKLDYHKAGSSANCGGVLFKSFQKEMHSAE